ncbi:MAG TPA: tetratricopeptide repeat protein [Candidatus Didemnitutus sp.]|nr:tetratricopeptide repeat protein [Candidatus Didemnitutus sp.]
MRHLTAICILLSAGVGVLGASDWHETVGEMFKNEQWAPAQHLLEAVVAREPNNADAWARLGETHLHRNQGEPAVEPMEKAVALDPNNANYQRHLGDAYGLSAQQASFFSKTGWAVKCKAAYLKAVELDPKSVTNRRSLLEFYRQAPGFAGGGMDLAYAEAAEIRKLDPTAGEIEFGNLYASEKKFPEATAAFESALKSTPDSYAALYQIGRLAAIGQADAGRGLVCLRRCLELPVPKGQPDFSPVQWRLGNILERQGDKAGARAAYEAAVKADPHFAPAAESLKKLGE